MSNATLEDRLKSVIGSLEKQQNYKYNPMTDLTLSYLYDILNDNVPDYILEIKKKTRSLKATIPDSIQRYLELKPHDKLEWKMDVIKGQYAVIVTKKPIDDTSSQGEN